MKVKRIFMLTLIATLATATVSIVAMAAGSDTFVVTPTNTYGWTFAQEGPTGTGEFVDGPENPPMGSGSARLTVSPLTGSEVLAKAAYQGTKFADITTLQYSTYQSVSNNIQAIALQFNVDSDLTDANNSFQGRLVYEPYHTQTVIDGQWQTWNTLNNANTGNWFGSGACSIARPLSCYCPQGNPCTMSEITAQFPNAGIHNTLGAVYFKAGSGWTAFDGNVDAFTIGINDGQGGEDKDTYDFNLHSTPTNKEQCKNGGWMTFNPPTGTFKNQGDCIQYFNTGK